MEIQSKLVQMHQAVEGGAHISHAAKAIYGRVATYYEQTSREEQEQVRRCRPCVFEAAMRKICLRLPDERFMAIHQAADRRGESVNRWCGRVLLEAIRRENNTETT